MYSVSFIPKEQIKASNTIWKTLIVYACKVKNEGGKICYRSVLFLLVLIKENFTDSFWKGQWGWGEPYHKCLNQAEHCYEINILALQFCQSVLINKLNLPVEFYLYVTVLDVVMGDYTSCMVPSFLLFSFNNGIGPLGFLPCEVRVSFPRESRLKHLCCQRSCQVERVDGHYTGDYTWMGGRIIACDYLQISEMQIKFHMWVCFNLTEF